MMQRALIDVSDRPTYMTTTLQAEPRAHGTASNPHIGVVNPSLEPHLDSEYLKWI